MEAVSISRPPLGEMAADHEAFASGISWAAVVAGAFIASALHLILLALGTGMGLSWDSSSVGRTAVISAGALVWLIIVQVVAFSIGGYLAGRLRIKWATIHTDEVYFRDTAHGFLVWAVGVVITAAFLGVAATVMMGEAGAPVTSGRTASISAPAVGLALYSDNYFVDSLFRSIHPTTVSDDIWARAQAGRILNYNLRQGRLSTVDHAYLSELVAEKTGIAPSEARQRVSATFADLEQTVDANRKAIAHLLLWTFVALLIGAFCASYAATIGGRERDKVVILTARPAP